MENLRLTNRLTVLASWIILLLAGAVSVAPLVPPVPPVSPSSSDFSVIRAHDNIEIIAREPRPIGTPANERMRANIIAQLQALGLAPEIQSIEAPNYYTGTGEIVDVVNVMARIPGTTPTTAVSLVGHYDTVPGTPGANDDASAVAIMLETARVILAGPPLRNDVILVFTDGEEPAPRFGSSPFVSEHPWARDIGFVINLEAIGTGGPSLLVEMNGPGRWEIDQYAEAVSYPTAFSFITTVSELIGGSNTDFSEFREAGIPGFGFAYMHGSSIYHTAADTPKRVNLRSLYQQGANTLALTRHFGDLELSAAHNDSNAVFFTIGRYYVVRYPTAWALPLVLLAGLVLILVVVRRHGVWLRILRSAGITFVTILIAAVAMVGVWTLIAGQRNTMGIAEGYVYLAGLLALTTGISFVIARLTRRQLGTQPDATGVVFVWWVFGLLTTIAAPGVSYLFVWPALAGGLTLLSRSSQSTERLYKFVGLIFTAGTTLVLVVPAIDIFYQFAQPRPGNPGSQILFIIAIPVMLIAMIVELLRSLWVRSKEDQTVSVRKSGGK